MHINGICDRYALITRQDCSNIDCRVVSVDKSLVQSAEDFRYCFGRLGKNRILSSNFYTACLFLKVAISSTYRAVDLTSFLKGGLA